MRKKRAGGTSQGSSLGLYVELGCRVGKEENGNIYTGIDRVWMDVERV